MRIIKKGNVKKPPEYIKTCPYCKTIFTYTLNDIFFNWVDGTDNLKCPECNKYDDTPFFKKKYKGDSNES